MKNTSKSILSEIRKICTIITYTYSANSVRLKFKPVKLWPLRIAIRKGDNHYMVIGIGVNK